MAAVEVARELQLHAMKCAIEMLCYGIIRERRERTGLNRAQIRSVLEMCPRDESGPLGSTFVRCQGEYGGGALNER